MDVPAPGSPQEIESFRRLQLGLPDLYRELFPDAQKPRTVVVIPSLSLDADVLQKVTGASHYEERMLCMLMLLRLPTTHVIYVTSQPVDPIIIDYALNLLPGIPVSHARKRLTLLSCHDASSIPLTQKLLDRPRLLRRLQASIAERGNAHMSCFNVTDLERTLAVRLGIPLYACDPELIHLGSKTGSREIFAEAGVNMPEGFAGLRDTGDLVEALTELKAQSPKMRRAVVKLNEGFSGDGNAVFSYDNAPSKGALKPWLRQELSKRLRFEAEDESWAHFEAKFSEMGGIVERFIEHDIKRSPSVQCRIDPLGVGGVISTHDQVLGGPSEQVFLGCTFPANEAYRLEIQQAGERVSETLKRRGVIGRFGIDFVSIKQGETWEHYAIEINLRKGGTTHPFMVLEFLTDGRYDSETGLYLMPSGAPRFYYASDNLQSPLYQGLSPEDLIDISVMNQLHFHSTTQCGVVFHLIGALSEFGKLGVVCIAASAEQASAIYKDTVQILDQEAQNV